MLLTKTIKELVTDIQQEHQTRFAQIFAQLVHSRSLGAANLDDT